MDMVTGWELITPLVTTFWVRALPSSFSTGTLVAEDATNAIGVMPQISKPRTSCSPPMYVRENGGMYLPPYPVTIDPSKWKARIWLLCQGACLKYLRSIAGRMVFTLPPKTLPAKSSEAKMLRPAVGEIGWLTVL